MDRFFYASKEKDNNWCLVLVYYGYIVCDTSGIALALGIKLAEFRRLVETYSGIWLYSGTNSELYQFNHISDSEEVIEIFDSLLVMDQLTSER